MKILTKILMLSMATLFFTQKTFASSAITFVWINNLQEIELITSTPELIDLQGLKVLNSSNQLYSFHVTKKTSDSVVLQLDQKMNPQKNYLVKTATQEIYGYYSLGYVAANLDYQGPLGVELGANKKEAFFRLWSPSAEKVTLIITSDETNQILFKRELDSRSKGLWETKLTGTKLLEGLHYQYKIQAYAREFMALDPYAKSMASFNPRGSEPSGKGVIIADPQESSHQRFFPPQKTSPFIGLELHVRDATIAPDSPVKESFKGTYLGLIEVLDTYKELGVTHLQLMPLQNFYTVNESQKAYQGSTTLRSDINYNWGYDPQNYFTPEGWFSSNARDPYARIVELQKLNEEIHKRGMGIILDVVYNHVFDGNLFEAAAPGMYLRRNRRGEVSFGTGAGATLESRSVMVRRLIVDSLKYWQDVFYIDGFRFDLMGFIDRETMKNIREALDPQTLIYGEAWVFTDLPHEDATLKTDLPHALNIGAFNDTSRDSYAGRNEGKGFVQGFFGDHLKVRSGIIGAIKNHPQSYLISQNPYDSFAESPLETLNYLTIHDGFTLWDKINLSVGGSLQSRQKIVKNAYALLLTSQGQIILPVGCEAGRSKPLYSNDPYPDRAHTSTVAQSENGIKHFHENSYASSDATNAVGWQRTLEFQDLRNYVKGLIALRKNLPGLHFEESSSIRQGLRFLESSSHGLIAYIIENTLENNINSRSNISAEKILVIHNSEGQTKNISVPEIINLKEWKILADCHQASLESFESTAVKIRPGSVVIEGQCSAIIIKSL